MATYVNDLRLKEIATGDESGTWGTSTNTNLELIAEAFSYSTVATFGSDADQTETIADGSTDPYRSIYVKVTSGVSLTATRTLTIAPNTVSKIFMIENATSGSQSIAISQGSGANVTIPNGDVKVIYTDGAGAGAAVVDAFANLKVTDPAQTNITSVGTLTGLTVVDTGSDAASFKAVGGYAVQAYQDATSANHTALDVRTDNVGGDDRYLIRGYADASGTPTENFRVAASGEAYFASNVGIGTTSPDYVLNTNYNANATFTNAASDFTQMWQNSGTNALGVALSDDSVARFVTNNGYEIAFNNASTETMRIDSSGNVGIGTSSPVSIGGHTGVLTLFGSNATALVTKNSSSSSRIAQLGSDLAFFVNTYENERMRIDSSGRLSVGISSSAGGVATFFGTGTGAEAKVQIEGEGGADPFVNFLVNNTTHWAVGARDSDSDKFMIANNSDLSSGVALTIDTAENVGIGETSPATNLHIKASDPQIRLQHSGNSFFSRIITDSSNNLLLGTGSNGAERMRIDSSGNLLVGTTTESTTDTNDGIVAKVQGANETFLLVRHDSSASSGGFFAGFTYNGSTIGSITQNGTTATAYNTSSDARLKDITGEARGLEVINALNPVAYNWKADGKADEGLIAQEVLELVPNAVTGSEEEYYQMDYSKLVVHLVKGMKEQQEQIESLKSEIKLLKGGN